MRKFQSIYFLFMCVLSLPKLDASENQLSPCLIGGCSMTNEQINILEAINHLDKACLLSLSAEDKEIREVIFNQLKGCLDCLKKDFFSKNFENAKKVAATLHENLGEILESCQNEPLIESITSCINDMMDAIEK